MLSHLDRVARRRIYSLCLILAFVAGFVNSVAFVKLGGYVSHVSGHATRAAVEFLEMNVNTGLFFLVIIFFFILGAALTTLMLRGRFVSDIKVSATGPMLCEVLVMLCVVWGWWNHARMAIDSATDQTVYPFYLYGLTLVMGMQNALLRTTSGIIVRTTHMTGVATDLGISLGVSGLHMIRVFFSRVLRRPDVLQNLHPKHSIQLQAMLLTAFMCGAVLGTFGAIHFSVPVLLFPCAILFVTALGDHFFHRRLLSERIS